MMNNGAKLRSAAFVPDPERLANLQKVLLSMDFQSPPVTRELILERGTFVRTDIRREMLNAQGESTAALCGLLLSDADEKVRDRAAFALCELGAGALPAREDLVRYVDIPKVEYDAAKINALRALGNLGPAARSAIPAIKEALREDRDSSSTHKEMREDAKKGGIFRIMLNEAFIFVYRTLDTCMHLGALAIDKVIGTTLAKGRYGPQYEAGYLALRKIEGTN